jgi:hypothetical protein
MCRSITMRLSSIYLLGALSIAAAPLSAAAQPFQANHPAVPGQYAATSSVCPTGWVWEPPGYMGNGHWRPAHCAARNTIPW